MKVLNLELPYKIDKDVLKQMGLESMSDMTRFMFRACVRAKYPKEIGHTESRLWAKVQDKTEESEDAPIEDAEFEFLRDTVKDVKLHPDFSRWYWILKNHMDDLDKIQEAVEKE